MATHSILGLDIGGANLKAATADKRAISVPFALWKQPDRLPAALGELVARFPDAEELAVTMTGELCDCFETKREGVNAILNAVLNVSRSRPVRVWGTDGLFHSIETARRHYLTVAAANWHALATFAGQFAPGYEGAHALLIDTGSTTTDIIPILHGVPTATGSTDTERLASGELVYVGVRRTPVSAILGFEVAAELFATTQDVYLLLGKIPDDRTDTDTADGRPAVRDRAHARMARMKCADVELMTREEAVDLAREVHQRILGRLLSAVRQALSMNRNRQPDWDDFPFRVITSGAGEFVAHEVASGLHPGLHGILSLNTALGPAVSACAPAYAVAVLATERGLP
ncbi:MAG TPA: hydantoinase/oxoprolinase family protein [Gemmataceae bacterium]|nr:hydantoinase/oxoprolinase family protein [Gemmataceae bacterium]